MSNDIPVFNIYNLNWQYTQVYVDSLFYMSSAFTYFWEYELSHAALFTFELQVLWAEFQLHSWLVEKQLQSETKHLTWSYMYLSRFTRFRLLFYISLFWYILYSAYGSSSLSWLFNFFPFTEPPSSITPSESPQTCANFVAFIPLNYHYSHLSDSPHVGCKLRSGLYYIDYSIPSNRGTDWCLKYPVYACKLKKN